MTVCPLAKVNMLDHFLGRSLETCRLGNLCTGLLCTVLGAVVTRVALQVTTVF